MLAESRDFESGDIFRGVADRNRTRYCDLHRNRWRPLQRVAFDRTAAACHYHGLCDYQDEEPSLRHSALRYARTEFEIPLHNPDNAST